MISAKLYTNEDPFVSWLLDTINKVTSSCPVAQKEEVQF